MHSDLDFIAGCRCTFLLSIYSNQNNAQLATCGLEVKRLAHAAEVRETEETKVVNKKLSCWSNIQ